MESLGTVGLGLELGGCVGRVARSAAPPGEASIGDRPARLIAVWQCGRVKEWVCLAEASESSLSAHPHNKSFEPTRALSRPVLAHGPRQPATPDRPRSSSQR